MKSCCEEKIKLRTDEEKKALIHRIHRISGQIQGIEKMIREDRYCDDILIQLSAVDKSIKSMANVLLDAHMHTCVVENIAAGNTEIVDEVIDLFRRFQ